MASKCSTDISESEITVIVNNIGPDLVQFGRRLGETETNLVEIQQGHESLTEKAYKLIQHWMHRNGREATKDRMIHVLKNIGRKDIADEISNEASHAAKEELFTNFIRKMKALYSPLSVPQPPRIHKDISIDNIFIDQDMEITSYSKVFPTTSHTLKIQPLIQQIEKYNIKRILVEGNPGLGKTTLTVKLASDWAKGREYISSHFDLVLLIPLREVGDEKLQDLIISLINKANGVTTIRKEDLDEYVAQHKVLILLDGYDEVESTYKKNYHPILKKDELPNTNVLVTSRCGMFSIKESATCSTSFLLLKDTNVDYDFWDCKLLLNGFSTDQQNELLVNHFEIKPEAIKKMTELSNRYVSELFSCPLILFWLGWMLENGNDKIVQTKTSFYKQLVNLILHKTLVRENKIQTYDIIDIFELPNDEHTSQLRKDILKLGRVAKERLVNENVFFNHSDLKFLENSLLLKSDLFIRYNSLIRQEEETFYEPMHITLLEFLAAFTVCNSINDSTSSDKFKNIISNLVKQEISPVYDSLFLPFIAGLSGKNAHWLFESLSPWASFLHIGEPGMVDIFKELEVYDDKKLIESLLRYVPNHYKMQPLKEISHSYYYSAFHKRLLKESVKKQLISKLDWCIDINPFPIASITIQTIRLLPCFRDILSQLSPISSSIHCTNLICIIHSNQNHFTWEKYLAVCLSIKADQHELQLEQLNSATCSIVLNETANQWSNIVFQKLKFLDVDLNNEHVNAITQLVKEDRISKGISILLPNWHKLTVACVIRLWEAVIQSTLITEFTFINGSSNFDPIFQFSLPFDIKEFQVLRLSGCFSIEHNKSFVNVNSIQQLSLLEFIDDDDNDDDDDDNDDYDFDADDYDDANLLCNFKNVNYFECFDDLFQSCLSKNLPLLSTISELSLKATQQFNVDFSLMCQMPLLTTLVLELEQVVIRGEWLAPINLFLVSVLKETTSKSSKLNRLQNLVLTAMGTKFSTACSFLISCLKKVKTIALKRLQLVFALEEFEAPKNDIRVLKQLLKRKQIKLLSIVNVELTNSSSELASRLPRWFPETEFRFSYRNLGDEETGPIWNQRIYETLIHSASVFYIELR